MKEKIEKIQIEQSTSIRRAMQAIDAGALGIALIVQGDTRRLVGVVTDGDIRRALLAGAGLESPVDGIPRPEAETAHVSQSVEEIAKLFSERVRVVPILDDEAQVVDLAVFDRRMHIPVAAPVLGEKELQYLSECVLTGWISSAGKYVGRFEESFARVCEVRHAVATCNGTAALHLALMALGVGPGDEVIVPALTFIATANAVRHAGGVPVFVDIEKQSWGIDPEATEASITSRTKAILPVHLYGHPADLDPLLGLAAGHGLAVIEDAAEAHGARYRGRRVGGFGDAAAFSFYGNKIITTGEGGMVTTNREDIARKVRVLRDHGMSRERRYWHEVLGYNYRITNLQAAVGTAQVERMEAILEEKARISARYDQHFTGQRGVVLQPAASWATRVCWLYSLLIDEDSFGRSRDEVIELLKRESIETRPFFYPVHQQPVYQTGQELPIAEQVARQGMNLPSAIGLEDKQLDRVAERLLSLRR